MDLETQPAAAPFRLLGSGHPFSSCRAFRDLRQMTLTRTNSKIDKKAVTPAIGCLALKECRNRPAQGEQGTTLVEIVIAGTVLAVGLSGLFGLLGTTVNQVKRGHTASGAQENTVARLDQMRNLTWASITNAATVATVLGTPTSSDSSSTISLEVITVSPAAVPQSSPLPSPAPLPTATPGPGFSVTKTGASVSISPSSYPNLNAEKLVNVTVTTEWRTAGDPPHQRQLSTLVSRAGSMAPKPVPSATPSPTP